MERIWEQPRQDRLSDPRFNDYEDIADACCEAWNESDSQEGKIRSVCSGQWAKWQIIKWDWYYQAETQLALHSALTARMLCTWSSIYHSRIQEGHS